MSTQLYLIFDNNYLIFKLFVKFITFVIVKKNNNVFIVIINIFHFVIIYVN